MADTSARILSVHGNAVAWSHDGLRLAFANRTKCVAVWELLDSSTVMQMQTPCGQGLVGSVSWCPDDSKIAGSIGSAVYIWDALSGRDLAVLKGHDEKINAVAWSPCGSKLASCSDDTSVRLWDMTTAAEVCAYEGHYMNVMSVDWSPDGNCLTSGSYDGNVGIWNLDGADHKMLKGHGDFVTSVAWNPDGKQVASVGLDCTTRLWDMNRLRSSIVLDDSSGALSSVSWHANGRKLATASWDRKARIWDLGKLCKVMEHSHEVDFVSWSPCADELLTRCRDTLQVWRL